MAEGNEAIIAFEQSMATEADDYILDIPTLILGRPEDVPGNADGEPDGTSAGPADQTTEPTSAPVGEEHDVAPDGSGPTNPLLRLSTKQRILVAAGLVGLLWLGQR